jgi:hypothetical protein
MLADDWIGSARNSKGSAPRARVYIPDALPLAAQLFYERVGG